MSLAFCDRDFNERIEKLMKMDYDMEFRRIIKNYPLDPACIRINSELWKTFLKREDYFTDVNFLYTIKQYSAMIVNFENIEKIIVIKKFDIYIIVFVHISEETKSVADRFKTIDKKQSCNIRDGNFEYFLTMNPVKHSIVTAISYYGFFVGKIQIIKNVQKVLRPIMTDPGEVRIKNVSFRIRNFYDCYCRILERIMFHKKLPKNHEVFCFESQYDFISEFIIVNTHDIFSAIISLKKEKSPSLVKDLIKDFDYKYKYDPEDNAFHIVFGTDPYKSYIAELILIFQN